MKALAQFVAATLGFAVVWLLVLPRPAVKQPIDFDHKKHDRIVCGVCHRGVETSTRAGFPPDRVCTECHNAAPQGGGAPAVWPTSRTSPPISWVRVNRMPDNVIFSHRRHVLLAKLDCATCHGDVAKRSTPPPAPAARIDMDSCESCHAREHADNDCAACHR